MTPTRTLPPRLAAAVIGLTTLAGGAHVFSQDLPEVRSSAEVFGSAFERAESRRSRPPGGFSLESTSSTSAPADSPFSVREPNWESAGTTNRVAESGFTTEPTLVPTPVPSPLVDLIPVQSLQPPELAPPTIDPAAAQLISPVQEATALPVLSAPEEVEPLDEPVHVPKPVSAPEAAPVASAEDLEGMLHGMLWITGALGLGAVLTLWMLKLWLMRGGRALLPAKSLQLIDTLRIGPRCGVYLVQTEAHRVLVGVEHGKSMCLMPLPASFNESLEAVDVEEPEAPKAEAGFERVADLFSARRNGDERAKGAAS